MAVNQFHLIFKPLEPLFAKFQGFFIPIQSDEAPGGTHGFEKPLGMPSTTHRRIQDNGTGFRRQSLDDFIK